MRFCEFWHKNHLIQSYGLKRYEGLKFEGQNQNFGKLRGIFENLESSRGFFGNFQGL
jgi:hypothetical protein